jgi:pimeloyl-ACP methyl ester carboxylesterase
MWEYSMPMFGEQVVALLDHLDLDQAVIAGTSLGANVALEAAALAPERLRGMVIEMPVLDGAMVACGVAFLPLLLSLRYGGRAMRLVQAAANAIPRGAPPFLLDVGLDTIRQDPAPSSAVLEGLFFGRTAPHRWQRRTFTQPALVIGHHRDPVHPFSDAGMLADELPNGRLLQASSILELRLAPERLTDAIAEFIDECWEAEAPAPPRAAGRRAATR